MSEVRKNWINTYVYQNDRRRLTRNRGETVRLKPNPHWCGLYEAWAALGCWGCEARGGARSPSKRQSRERNVKTICYATYCSKHPLYEERTKVACHTGWDVMHFEPSNGSGRAVDCLEVDSDLPVELDADDYEWPVTAYGDGFAATGAEEGSMTLRGRCSNEDYEGEPQ